MCDSQWLASEHWLSKDGPVHGVCRRVAGGIQLLHIALRDALHIGEARWLGLDVMFLPDVNQVARLLHHLPMPHRFQACLLHRPTRVLTTPVET